MTTPIILLSNNAVSTLAAPITSGATTATLATGTGSLFPNPSAGPPQQFFPLTFSDAATGLVREIVHVTARSGDTITMVRAQEGTVASAFTTGDNARLLWTQGVAESFGQTAAEQTAATQLFNPTGGYQFFNNGFVVQWGVYHTATGNADAISFPAPFPTACQGSVVTEDNATGWGSPPQPTIFGTSNRTTTGMDISGVRGLTGGGYAYQSGITAGWLAWGN